MPTFPKPPSMHLPAMIRAHATMLKLHVQKITTLETKAAATLALVPGAWEAITLAGGWANAPGAIPAQARLLTTTTVQVIGNIQGGSTADGTVIGTLTHGFYNTVHSHTFSASAVTGAGAVPNPVSQGSLASRLVDQVVVISPGQIPVHAQTFTVSGGHITIPSGGLGSNDTGDGDTVFSVQNVTSGLLNNTQTTPVNYNSGVVTLGTDGTLRIYNFNSAVTQISFHEASLPLFTA